MDELSVIIERCKKQEQKAQSELYAMLAPKVLAVCYRYLQSRDEAEDAMQEAFVKIFRSISQFRGQGSFEGWARRIAVNTALDQLRAKKKIQFDRNLAVLENISVAEEDAEVLGAQDLLHCLRQLPEGYRTIVNLYAVEDYSHAEIAVLLNIQEATSRSQYFRARQMMIRLMKEKAEKKNLKNA